MVTWKQPKQTSYGYKQPNVSSYGYMKMTKGSSYVYTEMTKRPSYVIWNDQRTQLLHGNDQNDYMITFLARTIFKYSSYNYERKMRLDGILMTPKQTWKIVCPDKRNLEFGTTGTSCHKIDATCGWRKLFHSMVKTMN